MTAAPRITVGIPVFRGGDLVGDALESVASQQFHALRVIVSVDGNDEESARVCRRYAHDRRFEIVVQPRRLGWAGNINWLTRQASTEFFGFLGQDDRLDPLFYQTLLAEADAHPEAVVITSYLQWFGARTGIQSEAQVLGTPFQRTLTVIERGVWFPFLGLRRQSVLSTIGDLRVDADDSAMEDVNWLLKALRFGPIRQVPLPLYHKRAHGGMVTMDKKQWSAERARSIWIQAWARLLVTAVVTAHGPDEVKRVVMAVVKRFATSSPDFDWFYEIDRLPRSERRSLVVDLGAHLLDCAPRPLLSALGTDADGIGELLAQLTPSILGFWGSDGDTPQPVLERRRILLDRDIAAGGWHALEEDSVRGCFRWTGPGRVSEFPVNVLLDRPYRIRVHVFLTMPGVAPRDLELLEDGVPVGVEHRETENAGCLMESIVRPTETAPIRELRLALRAPRTFCPCDLALNDDVRALGCAVNWIEIEPADSQLERPTRPRAPVSGTSA